MKKTTLVGLAAVVLCAADLSAQVCNGIAPFSAGKMRVGAGVRMPSGGTIWDGEFAVGAKTGWFGGADISIFDPEFTGASSSTTFGGFIGKPMMVDAKKTIEMCPQGYIQFGENSYNSFGAGVSLGKNFEMTSFNVIPFGGATLHRDANSSVSDVNLDAVIGAGFVLQKKWTIRPFLNVPLTNNREVTFGVGGFLNFGGTP